MKRILLAISFAAILTSCNKEASDMAQTGTAPENEIKLAVASVSVDVKSAYEATTPAAEAPLFARIYASENMDFSGNEYGGTAGYMNFTSGNLTGFCDKDKTSAPKYFNADKPVYLAGFYPALSDENAEKWSFNTETGLSATITFNGEDDVMASTEAIVVSKLSEAEDQNLTFRHMLTMLELKVKAGSEAAIGEWDGLYDIVLAKAGTENPANTVTVTYPSNKLDYAFSGNVEAGMKFIGTEEYTEESRYELTTSDVVLGYVLCQPVEAATENDEYTITVKTGRGDKTIPVNLKQDGNVADFTGNTSGYKLSVSLTFTVNEIQATATIEPWKEGGDSQIVVEG